VFYTTTTTTVITTYVYGQYNQLLYAYKSDETSLDSKKT